MAKVISQRTRGRRKEALRLTTAELVAALGAPGADAQRTVDLIPDGDPADRQVTLTVPKGAAIIPFELTREKNDENAREQIRKGAEDAGVKVAIASILLAFETEGVGEKPVFVVTRTDAPEPVKAPAKPRAPRKRK